MINPREFIYWLKGFLEGVKPESITKEQIENIKERAAEALGDGMKQEEGTIKLSDYLRHPHTIPMNSSPVDVVFNNNSWEQEVQIIPSLRVFPGTY